MIMKSRCFPGNLPSNRRKTYSPFPYLQAFVPSPDGRQETPSSPSSSGDMGTIFSTLVLGRIQVHVQKLLSIPATPPLHEAESTQRKLLEIWL